MKSKKSLVRITCLNCRNVQMEEFPKEVMARCNECGSLEWKSEE